MILTVEVQNKTITRTGDMKHYAWAPARPPKSRAVDTVGHELALSLAENHPQKERGYNPYNSTSPAAITPLHDIWRHKPKRA